MKYFIFGKDKNTFLFNYKFVVALVLSLLSTGCGLRNYEIVVAQQHAAISPGEVLRLEVLCPGGKHAIGGGGRVQSTPVGTSANYTLKTTEPAKLTPGGSTRTATGWSAIWTNSTDLDHPQVVTFTVHAVCARTD
jgi:hypothetical protein